MVAYAIIDDEGYPLGGGSRPDAPKGAILLPGEGYLDLLGVIRFVADNAGGHWEFRPSLPMPVFDGAAVTVTRSPMGSVLRIIDRATGASVAELPADDGELHHALPAPGTFDVIMDGPRPWLSSRIRIETGGGAPELAQAALAQARLAARAQVNAMIAGLRATIITDIPGQAAIYAAKEAEAQAWIAGVFGEFPLLTDEVALSGTDRWQVAQVWLNLADITRARLAESERVRVAALAQIAAAGSADEISQITATFMERD
jgi:hypothetical protein